MKFIINPLFIKYESFLKNSISNFNQDGEIIYKGRNLIKKFSHEDMTFTIKSFRIPHPINRIAYVTLRSSKAARSYYNGLELIRQGFHTPTPVAYIENYRWGLAESYYISIYLKDSHEMREFWFEPEIGNRKPILQSFGKFTAQLHQHNILHKDYSSGNVLYKIKNNEPIFYLVDINRMRFKKRISMKEGCKNFERLWLPDETYQIIASAYSKEMGYNEKGVKKILYYKNEFISRKG